MNRHELSHWQHHHRFGTDNHTAERRTRAVMWITLLTMVVEIITGWWVNSMALLADGWHMSSHALAIGLAAFAYAAARRYAHDQRFAFGTWKIEVLAGYTSAVLLLVVALGMLVSSLERFFDPKPIGYAEALPVAVLGLVVNVVCALILGHGHDHDHHHDHDHGHTHGHHDHHEDLNLKAAYVHVLADALTSVLAIAALFGGMRYGWVWLDPLMGMVGAVLVALWARGLLIDSGKVLLDREMDHPVVAEIREVLEQEADPTQTRISDLHVWRVGKGFYAAAVSLVTHDQALTAEQVRERLSVHEEIVHVTVEINLCCA